MKVGHRQAPYKQTPSAQAAGGFVLALFANRVGGSRSEPPVVDTGCYGAVASNHPGARNEEARVE